jgi:hypothetical protein
LESYLLMLKALKIAPCLPSAYEGLAQYESLAGYHTTAKKHLTLAHQLSPNNENIRFAWNGSLSSEQSAAELTNFIHEAKALDDKRRTTLSAQIDKENSRLKNHPTLQQLVMHIDYRDNLVLFEAPNPNSSRP